MSQSLSPASAILAAFRDRYNETLRPGPFFGRWQAACLAVALEALADQDETLFDVEDELVPAVRAVRTDRILAIAAELKGSDA